MSDNANLEDVPQPDPGNSPPENWTEPMSDAEQAEAKARLKEEAMAQATESGADFVVVDGKPVPVEKSTETTSSVGRGEVAVEFKEPTEPVQPVDTEVENADETLQEIEDRKDDSPAEPVQTDYPGPAPTTAPNYNDVLRARHEAQKG